MYAFVFREEPITILNKKDADPQAIGEAVMDHAAKNGGRIDARRMRAEITADRRHPMRKHLQWDEHLAAEEHRLDQVRELIRIVKRIDLDHPEKPAVRAFPSVRDLDGVSYRTVDEVLANVDLQREIINAAMRDINAFESRYNELAEICPLCEDIRERLRRRAARMDEARKPRRQQRRAGEKRAGPNKKKTSKQTKVSA